MRTAEAGRTKAGQDQTWRGLPGEQPEAQDHDSPNADTEREHEKQRAPTAVHRLAVLGAIALAQVLWLGSLAYFAYRFLT